jgi:hypothetical protein
MQRSFAAALGALLLLAYSVPAEAEEQVFRARYDASIWGLSIGRAEITSRFAGKDFALEGTFGSAGLARLFEPADGTASVSGTVTEKSVRPSSYRLSYRSGKKHQTTAIRFAGNRVVETINEPPLKKHDNWVPLKKDDLVGVSDPLTALMIPMANAANVCARTIEIYDGEMHAQLVLSNASEADRLASGAVTCRVRFVPVAGYRTNRSALKFLRDKAKILVAFAPVGELGIHSPVEATIGTEIGTVHIRAHAVE